MDFFFLPLLLYASTFFPLHYEKKPHSLSYLCSHMEAIPDCFISLCNNKHILHHLAYQIFLPHFSAQILHQKCINSQGMFLMAVLTGLNSDVYQ